VNGCIATFDWSALAAGPRLSRMSTPTVTRIAGTLMNVNSYLIATRDSVVVVDGMLTVGDARAVRAHLDQRGVPLRGLVVTHAHPDHYAGAAEILRDRADVPILATAAVKAAIERDDAVKDRIVGPMMGAEWPARRRFPDRVVAGEVALGDITLRVRDLGPGESPADSVWALDERHLFVGDLVYHGMHAYLADGYHREWLAVLDALAASVDPDATLYVGHGAPGGVELIAAQRRYVAAFVASVHAHAALPADARRAAVVADLRRLVPGDDLQFLLELSVDPVAAALAGEGS
jgi:glyoxylase-like metal-dependent hydrolase (beta-lactamase superfamily II)